MNSRRFSLTGLPALLLASAAALADPWLSPGDAGLRHDIAVLADRGVLRGPVMSWPLSWADVARDILNVDAAATLDAATQAALLRVQRQARRAMRIGEGRLHARTSVAAEPTALRTFSDTPRTEGEVRAGWDWTGERFAARLQGALVADPDDGQRLRPDGSYVGVNAWNFMISAGYMERWWGPGWEGSLILSNSARPIPALAIERNYSDAFKPRWLRWIGPWRASMVLGQLEGSRSDFNDARFLAMRVSFKPLQQLEIGLSRSAQWCGEGRPCGLGIFTDLLIGNDNDQPLSQDQPGNQLAGYDLRWAFKSMPLALYGQFIGEDEAGGLPSKFMGLMGAESWGDSRWGQWRAHAEYADTVCTFNRTPEFDCAYEHSLYTQGYRYRGRGIGHAMDGDGRMSSAGVLLVDRAGDRWELLVRRVDLNRDAVAAESQHTVAPLAAELTNLEISHTRELGFGRLRLGVGHDDYGLRRDGGDDSQTRGFIQWSKEFQ